MNWVRTKQLFPWVLIIALLANVSAFAAMMEGQSEQEKMDEHIKEMKEMKDMGRQMKPAEGLQEMAPLHKANEMLGKNVQTTTGDDLGTIENLLVDTYNNRVYLVILAVDNKQYPVPRSAFKMQKEKDVCMLNISKDQLTQAPSYDRIQTSDLENAEWRQRVKDYYRDIIPKETSMHKGAEYQKQAYERQERSRIEYEGQEKMTAPRSHPGRYVMLSDIIGLSVKDAAKKDLGQIEDVLIDSDGGCLAYALISYGGIVGIAQKTAAVPWTAIEVQRNLEYATLDADRAALETATVAPEDVQKLNQPAYARRFHEQFGQEPYWEVFGFVPAIDIGSNAAWQAQSAYNRKFNPQAMQTIEGTITNVGTFMPEKGAAPGLRLKVETPEGESLLVHVGPRRYAMQQDIKFTAGSDVKVKGSKTQIGERSVIMATEISSEGKTLKLRDEQGNPLWKLESIKPQPQPESMPKKSPEQKPGY